MRVGTTNGHADGNGAFYYGGHQDEVYSTEQEGEESISTDSLEESVSEYAPSRIKKKGFCPKCFTGGCMCHVCYVFQFLLYVLLFPLWAKWLVTAPMPRVYWNEAFPPFPLLATPNSTEIAISAGAFAMQLSKIPSEDGGLNHSCARLPDNLQTDEVNFKISTILNAPAFQKEYVSTVYPVILASSTFKDWWVVADRKAAHPKSYYRATSDYDGLVYGYQSPQCMRAPSTAKGAPAPAPAARRLQDEKKDEDTFVWNADVGSYVSACVTWDWAKASKLKVKLTTGTMSITTAELGDYCDNIGGVCGWSCGSNTPGELEYCFDGKMEANQTHVRGQPLTTPLQAGSVSIHQCQTNEGPCITSTEPFSKWKCHSCQFGIVADSSATASARRAVGLPRMPGLPGLGLPLGAAGDSEAGTTGAAAWTEPDHCSNYDAVTYESFPRMKVGLKNATMPLEVASDAMMLAHPVTIMLVSAETDPDNWRDLYWDGSSSCPPPRPAGTKAPEDYTRSDPVMSYAMTLERLNRVDIDPVWCFGKKGQLYLVACAINTTQYDEEGFEGFKPGQKVAPPPFNDRCLAVGGVCGFAGQEKDPSLLTNCDANGNIIWRNLTGVPKDQKNQSAPVWLFVYTLLIGFAVKVVMLCPGIFSPYRHAHRYHPEMTEQLRYILVCAPSAGENKCTVLRNLIGGIGTMPRDCRCRYHVVCCDEGHRHHMKVMWQALCDVVAAIPNYGGKTYEENLSQFFQVWVEDTKKMDLNKLEDDSKKVPAEPILERMSGKASLNKLKKEHGWSAFNQESLKPLEAAVNNMLENLRDVSQQRLNLHLDDVADWEPKDRRSIPLRLHYLSRAKPNEDERTIKAQHVATGTWYYQVPSGARNEQWLELRRKAKECVPGSMDDNGTDWPVPLRTSRGKAGGLNFTENYLSIYAERPENVYGDERDDCPCLYSICDARHQFQVDFFHTTIPYFFDEDEDYPVRNESVAFTQCPQYFHEMQDKLDYLDNNNAQFFRLNCMIRNCCGGVSSCGTNGTWMIKHRTDSLVWENERKRVRDLSKRKNHQVVERRVFHESCKVEDTASSLQQVLAGRRSQFINRRLSYGMAKNPTDYLAAVQRWAEGGVVLSLQTFLGCHQGVWMVWVTFIFFIGFIASLFRLMGRFDTTFLVVKWGWVEQETIDLVISPIQDQVRKLALRFQYDYWSWHTNTLDDYVTMSVQFAVWLAMCGGLFFGLLFITKFAGLCSRRCCLFPDEMRWWGRLLISMDNLTYFLWFWTSFFWIGFNYYSVFAVRDYHFEKLGMFSFMFIIQVLSWGMIIASSMRYTLENSMEANEVILLTMDNIWRSTQLFYITAPLMLYSIIKGIQDYMRYQFYGEDISYWVGGDRGAMSKNLVKYWTLLLIIGAVVAWAYYFIVGRYRVGVASSCIIVTLIALDVLHPCAYLWVGEQKLTREEAHKMTWGQALFSKKWWERRIYALVLNPTVTGVLKWLGPAWFVVMPFLTLIMPYIGINQAFMVLNMGNQR